MTPHIAFVFPGQGSQVVGMGQMLYEAYAESRQVLDSVARVIQADEKPFLDILFEGPEALLTQTRYTQPAILGVSLAALAAFRSQYPEIKPEFVAGHSLGEYSALFAAGVLSLEEAISLVQYRAQLMNQAEAGAMAAVLGLDQLLLEQVLAEISSADDCVVVANYNSPTQQVISGTPSAVSLAAEKLKAAGAKRVIPLNVGGAFHSPLMSMATEVFAQRLGSLPFQPAQIPVITNVDAQPTQVPELLKEKLSVQMNHAVCWSQTMATLVEQQVDIVVEFGPGTVLSGLFKKTFPSVRSYQVSDPNSLSQTVAGLREHLNGLSVSV